MAEPILSEEAAEELRRQREALKQASTQPPDPSLGWQEQLIERARAKAAARRFQHITLPPPEVVPVLPPPDVPMVNIPPPITWGPSPMTSKAMDELLEMARAKQFRPPEPSAADRAKVESAVDQLLKFLPNGCHINIDECGVHDALKAVKVTVSVGQDYLAQGLKLQSDPRDALIIELIEAAKAGDQHRWSQAVTRAVESLFRE